ncbi:MAG: LysR substrate-binding domain-containing protein [Rikenellaceae bacterium]
MITDFRLTVFAVVARELSFTKAAVELNISQPAVTKHIKELERLSSMPLFRRHGSRIALTAGGEMLLERVRDVLEAYERLNDSLQSESGTFSGRVRMGASTTIIQYILPPILAKFHRAYPDIEIVLKSGNSEQMARWVESEELDFAIVEGAGLSTSFHYEHFGDDELVLVGSKPQKGKLSLDELSRVPLVIREVGSGTLEVVERHLSESGLSRRDLNITLQLGSSEGIIRYILASKSYAFISMAAVRDRLDRGELFKIELDIPPIIRPLRYLSLHGKGGRLANIIKEFFAVNYNL